MMRLLLIFTTLLTFTLSGKTVDDYVQELRGLDKKQYILLALAYNTGKKHDFELTLTAIVWKESSFGKQIANTRDGKHGSFGIGQILLDTAMVRNGYKTERQRVNLKMKLLTDNIFNLEQAIKELEYWKSIYKDRNQHYDWLRLTVASYNAGWKTVRSPKGKQYADDVMLRIKAIKRYFLTTKKFNDKVSREHLKSIQDDVKRKYGKKKRT